jgi:hypothetical protein
MRQQKLPSDGERKREREREKEAGKKVPFFRSGGGYGNEIERRMRAGLPEGTINHFLNCPL